ncbi:hypothetical protein [Neolewinella agarilytica]|uniref:Outer membrane protein beta-barrel domain-containing protein n=1 Tax=Neolewinella agarilytica TaxID=478744 RepID=A0A1H9F0D1_9BACT|nr:hypothetical protein [Neolewinella agarilytica]SEQ31444.1 hypothetical protein SAMN05444359_10838 [Neolewinella agarilytica]
MTRFYIFLILSCLSLSSFAQSESKPTPVKLVLSGALEFGGDEVAEVLFTNGDSQSVNAGQGGSLFAGAQVHIPSLNQVFLRGTVGFKYVTTAAENVNIRMTRVPVLLTAHYLITDAIHIGGGLVMHTGIKFKADGLGADIPFDAAFGPRIEAGYKGLALTYTAQNYVSEDGDEYAANAFGISYTFTIPK